MTSRTDRPRSVNQIIGNQARRRRLGRDDAFTAYVMDRLLYRIGESRHSDEFWLKGGVLVANLVDSHHRFTRDIDMLRRHGRPSPHELREIFRDIVAVPANDGILFKAADVRAVKADHDDDGYDGVKLFIRGKIERRDVEVRIDVGFGDAVVPPPHRLSLSPFIEGDAPATVLAYGAAPVIAEKVETLLSKFPVVLHRLKDVLDVVALSKTHVFEGAGLAASLGATLERRRTRLDVRTLDDMQDVLGDRRWRTAWASMLREKVVVEPSTLQAAVDDFDVFVRPIVLAVASEAVPPRTWSPGGPWR